MSKWTRGPYGGEGWRISGGKFVLEHGLSPMSSAEMQVMRGRISEHGRSIVSGARSEGANPRMVAVIGWSETGLKQGLRGPVGAQGPFGILPSTAKWLTGRAVSEAELNDWTFAASLCGRYLVRAGRAVGWGAQNPLSFPVLLSCYNAGFGSGKVRRSSVTPFRMVYHGGADGGYIPRGLRAWNALPRWWPKSLLVGPIALGAAAGVVVAVGVDGWQARRS